MTFFDELTFIEGNSTIELISMYINSNLQKLTLLFDKGEIASFTQKNFFFSFLQKASYTFSEEKKRKK
jgi:hypothetical protein